MKKLMILMAILISLPNFAGVNLKNGNFYISYSDIKLPGGGKDLEIVRTYNSKATEMGWFGFGWGSKWETYLVVSADGSVIVHENGSGALTRFVPKTTVNSTAAAQRIIKAMRNKKARLTKSAADDLVKKLAKDAELRQIYARRYDVKGKLASGTILYSNNRGLQQLKKLKKGFIRRFNNGTKEYFNDDGQLEKSVDKNNYTVFLTYKKKELKSMKDSLGKQIFFEWYNGGKRVKSLWANRGKKAKYTYQGDDLVESTDTGGFNYKYKYDSNHNLSQVKYKDGKTLDIKYEPKTFFVSSVKQKDGRLTKYKYESNPKNPNDHYWTVVSKQTGSGKFINDKYEYEIRTKADGERYTYRIATTINGLKTETTYTECCSLPKMIKRGSHVTNFEYNKKGLLTKKTSSSGTYVELDYHPKFNKITKVVNNKGTTQFSYDNKGNLEVAKNKGKVVRLVYNLKGRIRTMVEKDNRSKKSRTLKFVYNELGKPTTITMKGIGKIDVKYDDYGEIKKVDSKQGHKMALQVTQAFQSLLAIVKPAGVSLSL